MIISIIIKKEKYIFNKNELYQVMTNVYKNKNTPLVQYVKEIINSTSKGHMVR